MFSIMFCAELSAAYFGFELLGSLPGKVYPSHSKLSCSLNISECIVDENAVCRVKRESPAKQPVDPFVRFCDVFKEGEHTAVSELDKIQRPRSSVVKI